ncbi:MAG: hypothetical protein H6672_20700 [Anaerolineaceae bacterium]|nr:hypothetical protein [Anaerolineaceae bacterium]
MAVWPLWITIAAFPSGAQWQKVGRSVAHTELPLAIDWNDDSQQVIGAVRCIASLIWERMRSPSS